MIDVVIIGAGIAGLTCAKILSSYPEHINVTVLEASNRIGGRIKTITTKDGTVLDLGAQFIHGTVGNPLYDFAVDKELITNDESKHFQKYSHAADCFPAEIESMYSDQEKLGEDVQTAESCVEEFVDQIYKLRDENVNALPYKNVGEFMMNLFNTALEKSKQDPRLVSVLKSAFMKWAHHENIASGCRSVFDLDLRGFLSYVELEGDSVLELSTQCEGGYAAVVDEIAADIPQRCIKLNSEVTKIGIAPKNGTPKLKISCGSDSHVFYADTAVVTVSVGVLKDFLQNDIFAFQLPEKKRSTIEKLHLANVVKIFFKFKIPISPDISFFSFFQPPKLFGTKEAFECTCPMLERIGDSDWWLLWVICDKTEFQCENPEKYLNDIFDSCSTTYSAFPHNRVDPDSIHVVDWKQDPYCKGAYTYLRTGTNEEAIAALAEPLSWDGVDLLFAGEATSERFYSTTHGAYESGLREARNIISKLGLVNKENSEDLKSDHYSPIRRQKFKFTS